MVRQALPTPSAISSDINFGIQTLETKSEELESSLASSIYSSLESVKTATEQLAASVSLPSRSVDLQSLEATLSSLAGGVSVDPELKRNLQTLQTEVETRGSEWAQTLRGGLSNLQVQLTELQEKVRKTRDKKALISALHSSRRAMEDFGFQTRCHRCELLGLKGRTST